MKKYLPYVPLLSLPSENIHIQKLEKLYEWHNKHGGSNILLSSYL